MNEPTKIKTLPSFLLVVIGAAIGFAVWLYIRHVALTQIIG
jgi:hypothetical protein